MKLYNARYYAYLNVNAYYLFFVPTNVYFTVCYSYFKYNYENSPKNIKTESVKIKILHSQQSEFNARGTTTLQHTHICSTVLASAEAPLKLGFFNHQHLLCCTVFTRSYTNKPFDFQGFFLSLGNRRKLSRAISGE
jgi:hypothetical protein